MNGNDRGPSSPPAGHRVVPHTADVIIEAWAPTKGQCLEHAVLALVESFVESDPGVEPDAVVAIPFTIDARTDDDQVVALLEEVIYVVETKAVVPIGVQLTVDAEGVAGTFDTVAAEAVELVGAVPKGVSRHGLEFRLRDRDGWWCRALVDV
ncbi:archease [Rhabdothermincola sp.]|uniref:archease n=1 Tax=Rhabdothermincola sp. TaxID=2820405 RepID=UPI002FE10C00